MPRKTSSRVKMVLVYMHTRLKLSNTFKEYILTKWQMCSFRLSTPRRSAWPNQCFMIILLFDFNLSLHTYNFKKL